MLNFTGVARAPVKFLVTMKPTALAKNYSKSRGMEHKIELVAFDRDQAVAEARKTADAEGYRGYAITKITEVKQ